MTSMPEPAAAIHRDPSGDEVVLGVDTHKDVHVAVVVNVLGVVLGSGRFPTTAAGYRDLLVWAAFWGPVRRAGVEGTGSYGAALARFLAGEGVKVFEVGRPDRAMRRRRGKTDAIDAEAAARAVLSGQATAVAKTGDGPVEMARMLRLAKESAVKARTQAINQLKAVLVSTDPQLRSTLSGLGTMTLIRRCVQLTPRPVADTTSAAVCVLRLLAERISLLSDQIRDLKQQLEALVHRHAPKLLERPGIGPDTAAALLITAGDNPGRLRSEASFAALCGVSPVEASSGKSQRRRLNQGGDRQANAALYRIVLTRVRIDERTRAYLNRRISEGKTRREAVRCLKRYVAREVHALLRPLTATRPHNGMTT